MNPTDSRQCDGLNDARIQPLSQCILGAKRLVLLLGLVAACSGCSLTQGLNNYIAYNDSSNDFVMGWRNSVWASQAWHNQKQYYADHAEFRAFGAGFRDGYESVASGGTGCPPPLPPRKYWTWQYQTAEGQCKVAAWFEGFGHGARAAEEDGAGNFQDIQVSYLIEAQYSPEFQAGQFPLFGHGEYEIPGEPIETLPREPIPGAQPQLAPPVAPQGQGVAPASWNMPIPRNARTPAVSQPPQLTPPGSMIQR